MKCTNYGVPVEYMPDQKNNLINILDRNVLRISSEFTNTCTMRHFRENVIKCDLTSM